MLKYYVIIHLAGVHYVLIKYIWQSSLLNLVFPLTFSFALISMVADKFDHVASLNSMATACVQCIQYNMYIHT